VGSEMCIRDRRKPSLDLETNKKEKTFSRGGAEFAEKKRLNLYKNKT